MNKQNLVVMLQIIFAVLFTGSVQGQNTKPWNGKKCAVVLTYDDAYDQQLDNAVPVLDSLSLKASFYITAFSRSVQTRAAEWKKLAATGHELGNHTLFHPCAGNQPGRSFVIPEYDLSNYSIKRIEDEIRMTNVFLHAMDGKTQRTFAFTCGDMKIGDSAFINGLKNDFIAARAVRNEMHTIDSIDLYNVDCYMVNNNSAAEMIGWVKKAAATNSLLVILFHGVGGGNALDVSTDAHRQLLSFISRQQQNIWVAPMIEVAQYIKNIQSK